MKTTTKLAAKFKKVFSVLGSGLVTGASDDDCCCGCINLFSIQINYHFLMLTCDFKEIIFLTHNQLK